MLNSSTTGYLQFIHTHFLANPSRDKKILLCYSVLINNKGSLIFPVLFYAFFTCITTPLCWWDVKTQLGLYSSYLCYVSYYYAPVTHFQTPVFKRGCVWQFYNSVVVGGILSPMSSLVSLGWEERYFTSDCVIPWCLTTVISDQGYLYPNRVPQQLTGTVYRGSGEARCSQEITVASSTLGSWSPCRHLTNSCWMLSYFFLAYCSQ